MLHARRVLIAEDEPFTAMDLKCAVEAAKGWVVGPFSRLVDAIETGLALDLHGAILDVKLADDEVTELAHRLFERGVTIVFHTASPVPDSVVQRWGDPLVCPKPMNSARVIAFLVGELDRVDASRH
jgi:hypothetical protein